MDAIILVGGAGSRVRRITNDEIPKVLIKINGQPFLEHLIYFLYNKGVRVVHLGAGFKSDVLEEYLRTRIFLSSVNPYMDINLWKETEPLDTGGGLFNVLNRVWLRLSDPFLVLNGDCIIDIDEDNFEEYYYDTFDCGTPAISMFTCYKEHDGRYGSLKYAPYNPWSNNTDITAFENGKPGESWINCGWYIFQKRFFDKYKKKDYNGGCFDVKRMSLEKDIFPEYLKDNSIGGLYVNTDAFLEIGTPDAIKEAEKILK